MKYALDMELANAVLASKSTIIQSKPRSTNVDSSRCKKTQDGRFSGRYCEKCVTCPGLRCNEYESCVLCRQFKTGPWSEAECSANCSSLSLQSVGSLEPNEEAGDKRCTFSHNQCRYEFMYNEYANSEKLLVLEQPACPAVPLTLGVVLIVIGAVVLLGLAALLVWKLVTSICDRREYARFEQERANAKFDEVSFGIIPGFFFSKFVLLF